MRLPIFAGIIVSVLLLIAGVYLFLNAPELVHAPVVRRLGERLHWSGAWAMTRDGCFFQPDYERWERNFTMAGGILMLAGAGIGIGFAFWRLRSSSPVAPPRPSLPQVR